MQNLIVRLGADMSSFRKELGKARNEFQNFTSFMGSQMSKISSLVAGTAITLGVGEAIKDATKVEGAIESVNRLMGESAQEFLDWSETTSKALGISKSEALDYGRTFSNLTSIFTSSTEETMKTTQDLLKTSAIIASKTGRSMEDVMFRMRSGFLGNTEAVEDLGITVYVNMIEASDAFKRFANGKHWNDLDFRMQQQIRYYAMLEQANKKFGTQITDNTAFRILQFTASLKDLRLAIGQAFLPLVYTVLPILTDFITGITQTMKFVSSFTRALLGVSAVQASAKSINTVTTSVKQNTAALGANQKKLKGYLAGFDEVNSMPTPEESVPEAPAGGGGIGDPQNNAASGMGAAMEDVNQKAVDMANTVKASFQTISDFIVKHRDIIVPALTGIATAIIGIKLAMTSVNVLGSVFTAITNPVFLLGAAIAALVAGFLYFYNTNESFRGTVDSIFESIKTVVSDLWSNVLVPLGTFLSATFIPIWKGIVAVVSWLWTNVFVPFGAFLSDFYTTAIQPLVSIIGDALYIAFDTVYSIAKDFWQLVLVPLGKMLSELLTPAVEALTAVFKVLWNNVLVPFATFLKIVLLSVFGLIANNLKSLWENILKPISTFISGAFKQAFKTTFEFVGETIGGLKTTLGGILKFITGVFTGDWSKAWEGLKDIVSGVFDSLVATVKLPINLIIDMVNSLIKGLSSISIDIPSWMPEYGGKKFGVTIPTIPHLAQGGIVTQPTIAQVGEAGKEMIVPLENTSFVDKLAGALGTAVMTAMQMSNTGNRVDNREVVIKIDGNSIAKAINPYTTKEAGRVGTSILSIS